MRLSEVVGSGVADLGKRSPEPTKIGSDTEATIEETDATSDESLITVPR